MLMFLACKNGYVPPCESGRPLNFLFMPGDRVRRVRRMVHRRHNKLAVQNNAVSVPRFIGTVIRATNVQHHLLLGIRQYNVPCLQTVYTFWP